MNMISKLLALKAGKSSETCFALKQQFKQAYDHCREREARSGYDEKVGLMALDAAWHAVESVSLEASGRDYCRAVIAKLEHLRENYNASGALSGEYTDGRSSIGSLFREVSTIVLAHYPDLEDTRTHGRRRGDR